MRGGASAGAAADARARTGAVVVAGVVLVYALSLRRFGLDLVDEGTLLGQFAAMARGAAPYRDFQSGYGPLGFYWNGAVLRWLGGDVVAVRTVLAAVHAASAGLLYAIALLWGMLRPVAPGAFATFNVPYPSWWAEALGYGAVLLLLAAPLRIGMLAVAGALWGLAFLAKQNAGVFGLGGMVVHLALTDPRAGRDNAPWLGGLLGLAMAAGLLGLSTKSDMTPLELVVLGLPVLLLAIAVVRVRPSTGAAVRALAAGGGFVAVTAPALVALAAVVGGNVVVREVFHVGSGAAERFRLAYPTPLALVADAWRGAPGWIVAGRRLVDDLWLVGLPLAAIAGALRLVIAPSRMPAPRVALVTVGALLYLQLYPRADQWHALPAAGLLVVLGLCLLADLAPGRRGLLAAGAIALAALRSLPTAPVVGAVLRPVPPGAPTVAHASIRWDLVRGPALTRAPAVADALAGVRSLFGFPALAFFNFVTDAPSPVRHDYFFPGHPGPEEVRAMLARLEAAPPEAVVMLDAPIAFFPASFRAHPDVVAWLRSPAWVRTRIPPYTIGRRARP